MASHELWSGSKQLANEEKWKANIEFLDGDQWEENERDTYCVSTLCRVLWLGWFSTVWVQSSKKDINMVAILNVWNLMCSQVHSKCLGYLRRSLGLKNSIYIYYASVSCVCLSKRITWST